MKRAIQTSNFFKQVFSISLSQFIFTLYSIFLIVSLTSLIYAASSFECSILSTSSCTGAGNISLLKLRNDTNGYWNAHAQNETVGAYSPVYDYSVCCYSNSTNLSTSCEDTSFLKLSNFTDAHVQIGSYSGPNSTYPYPACLSANPGMVSCTYSSGSCPVNYACLGSIASSELWAANQTDSHVGPCAEYNTKVCCILNTPPIISNVILNSTYGTNYSYENLTVYFNELDLDGDAYTNITDWRRNGKSIALLHMAFNTNISSVGSNMIRDYSSFENNGTLGAGNSANSPFWNYSGKVGGTYNFDGINDYIYINNSISLNVTKPLSISVWVKPSCSGCSHQFFISKSASLGLRISSGLEGGDFEFFWGDGTSIELGGYTRLNSGLSPSNNTWYHVVGVHNGTNMNIYVNGVSLGNQNQLNSQTLNGNPLLIGSLNGAQYFNGTIDEIHIFNHSLSANQILTMYQAGIENHSVQRIHSDETYKFENWSVTITPNDGLSEGISVFSNNLTIRGSSLNVTLLYPANGNYTRLRTPLFIWNVTDANLADISFLINITAIKLSGQYLCSDLIYQSHNLMNFTPSSDLKCFYDNNYQYQWLVRANDSESVGNWSAIWTFNMTSVVNITLPVEFITFGNVLISSGDNTSDNSPAPFTLQNEGNCLVNVSINASNMWQTYSNPSTYFQYKVRASNESNSFNDTYSTLNWTFLPTLMNTSVSSIAFLKYPDASDSASVDIHVQVPQFEPAGFKESTVTFLATFSE